MSRHFPKSKGQKKQKITDRWQAINDGSFASQAQKEKKELAKGCFYVYGFKNWILG